MPKEELPSFLASAQLPELNEGDPIQQLLDHGGLPSGTMSLLTGTNTETMRPFSMSDEEILHALQTAAEAGQPLTMGTEQNITQQGIHGNHCYSISYDPATQSIRLTNPSKRSTNSEPLGKSGEAADGTLDGTFTVSLDEFREIAAALFITSPIENTE